MKYGQAPKLIGEIKIDCNEMMFYQYLPIKMKNSDHFYLEERLKIFKDLIEECNVDFISSFGRGLFDESFIYLTAKRQFQSKEKLFNRTGFHCDGFMTEDINFIWSDKNSTVFNSTEFNLTMDDSISLKEMEDQALVENNFVFAENSILRLDQFNVHKVNENIEEGFRTFVKISFSKDKYNLEGNSRNYLVDYNWEMKKRKTGRNIPQIK